MVRAWLPEPPAEVVEVGCGPLGGFVPMLRADGYEAVGVDPAAPDQTGYLRVELESMEQPGAVDAVVASTSLHHVAEPAAAIDRVASMLSPGGRLVVVEWDWEALDEPTAEWGFRRLPAGEEQGWLGRRRDGWLASGRRWDDFFRDWAREAGLHAWPTLLRLLDGRFQREHLARGPYLFPELGGTSEEEEQAAIDAGEIRATRVDYLGSLAA